LLASCFAICTAVLIYSLGIGFLADPWNAYVAFLPWMLAVVLAWATALGRRWALPSLVAVSSLVVGSHVGYAPCVAAIVLVAVIGLVRSHRRRHPWRSLRVPLLVALGVLPAVWAPALVQEAKSDQGNLTSIARSEIGQERLAAAWDDNRSRLPIGTSLGLVSHQFDIPAPWMGSDDLDEPGWHVATRSAPWGLFASVAVFAAGVVVAHRRRRRGILALQAVAGAAAVGALVAAVTIRGVPYEWLLRPAWVAGFAVWLATAWAFVDAVTDSVRIPVRSVMAVFSVVAALGVSVVASTGRFAVSPWEPYSRAVEALIAPTTRAIPRDATVYLWQPSNTETEGLTVALERVGVRVETQLSRLDQPDRVIPIAVVEGRAAIDAFLREHPGTTPLALYQPNARRLEGRGTLYQGFAMAVLRPPSLS
jgi:hypothetical protein